MITNLATFCERYLDNDNFFLEGKELLKYKDILELLPEFRLSKLSIVTDSYQPGVGVLQFKPIILNETGLKEISRFTHIFLNKIDCSERFFSIKHNQLKRFIKLYIGYVPIEPTIEFTVSFMKDHNVIFDENN